MTDFKKTYKQLWKNYNRQLKKLHKVNFNNLNNNLEYFVTYLRFMRDYYILTEPLVIEDKENIKVSAIVAAVKEYDNYCTCKDHYYGTNEDGTTKYLIEGTPEEVNKKFNEEKEFHWISFWQLVAFNIEDWLGNKNVAIQ